MDGVVCVTLDYVNWFVRCGLDECGEGAEGLDWVAGYADVVQEVFFVAETAEFGDGGEDFGGRNEFDVVEVDYV